MLHSLPQAPTQAADNALNHLDEGIKAAVMALREYGIETIESCQGGDGHAFPEPTVRFFGGKAEGYRALSIALQCGLRVAELRRVWPILDMEPTGPYWELTFTPESRINALRG
jgi:hypothetical protein